MGGKKSNHIRKFLRSFTGVRSWQLLLILIPLLFVIATLLRLDHLKMVELREAVLVADASEDDAATSAALARLQEFVTTHIVVNAVEHNGVQSLTFGTGPFYLEHQYLRAANAAIAAAEANLSSDANPYGNIYAAVSAICRPQAIANGWAWNNPNYLNCWTSELAKYPASDNLDANLTAAVPSTELYRHEFLSPLWAPTWSGFTILVALIIIIIIVIRFLIWCVLHIALLFLGKH